MKEAILSLWESSRKVLWVRPHPAGMPFIVGGGIATLLFTFVAEWLAVPAASFTLFCLFFFRDPPRVVPQDKRLVVSPADGRISAITENVSLLSDLTDNVDYGEPAYTRISIFLSVLDVHVNRLPVAGKITRKIYRPGKFFNADLDKASEDNERCSFTVKTEEGHEIGVVQIAGMIARRIVNTLDEGQDVVAGARFGIIRFGSRVDVYLPAGFTPLVCVGQRAVGGETVLAERAGDRPARTGVTI